MRSELDLRRVTPRRQLSKTKMPSLIFHERRVLLCTLFESCRISHALGLCNLGHVRASHAMDVALLGRSLWLEMNPSFYLDSSRTGRSSRSSDERRFRVAAWVIVHDGSITSRDTDARSQAQRFPVESGLRRELRASA